MEDKKRTRPRVDSEGLEELNRVDNQLEEQKSAMRNLTLEEMSKAPKVESEQQTKMSQKEIESSKEIYLKPKTKISCGAKDTFNERFRDDYNFQKEYVNFIAENIEIIGESLDIWTRPFPGLPAEEWIVPVNTPVWGPRYLAEQIKKCSYHRLVMVNQTTGADGKGQYYGTMTATNTIQRLDAHPVSKKKSIFMNASGF